MDKKQKIVNADDQEVLNPDAVHSYDAGTEEDITGTEDVIKQDPAKENIPAEKEKKHDEIKEDKPFPDEIANPEEQEDEDKMA